MSDPIERRVEIHLPWQMLAIMVLLLILFVTACQPVECELPFETIERQDAPGTGEEWESKASGLMIITTPEEVDQLDKHVTEDGKRQLRVLDYNTHFALIAFLGWQPTGHRRFQIERVVRRGDEVAIYAQAGTPTGTDEVSSPYHVVSIRKEGEWGQEIHFKLYLDNNVAASRNHFIP